MLKNLTRTEISHTPTSCRRQEGAGFGVIGPDPEDLLEFGGRLSHPTRVDQDRA
jgi:hypothetical protein